MSKIGIFTSIFEKWSKVFHDQTASPVQNFSKRDSQWWIMPQMEDFLLIKNDYDERVYVQKWLLLCNLLEFYTHVKVTMKIHSCLFCVSRLFYLIRSRTINPVLRYSSVQFSPHTYIPYWLRKRITYCIFLLARSG